MTQKAQILADFFNNYLWKFALFASFAFQKTILEFFCLAILPTTLMFPFLKPTEFLEFFRLAASSNAAYRAHTI